MLLARFAKRAPQCWTVAIKEDDNRGSLFGDDAIIHPVAERRAGIPGFCGGATVAVIAAGARLAQVPPTPVRGLAVRVYTGHGTFDLTGNDMPVFFIQDSMTFPDLIYAVKPRPCTGASSGTDCR